MGGEIGSPHFEWKVNCFLKSGFRLDEDHTEEKKALPSNGSFANSDNSRLLF